MAVQTRVFPRKVIIYDSVMCHARCEECRDGIQSIYPSLPEIWYREHEVENPDHHLYRWKTAEVTE